MAEIRLDSVTKIYGDDTLAVDDFNLTIDNGEFLTLVGPSGSGKSTILRMIAGLEDITDGEIVIGEEVVNFLPPRKRDIAMVFQSYALYPHLNVRDNMAFGLRRSTDLSREEINRRVEDAANLMGIGELLDNKPKHLSGGQRQRVATGRAIVREPAVFLFDEPLSNLDAKLRKHMRTELQRLQQQLDTTTVYVTHDQEEAMTMSDRIAILNEGQLQQVGPPREVYNEPHNLFVAQFIGSPSMNTFDVEFTSSATGGRLRGDVDLDVHTEELGFVDEIDTSDCILGIRPEHITVSLEQVENAVPVRVDIIEPVGSHDLLYFTLGEAGSGEDGESVTSSEDELKALIEPQSVPTSYEEHHETVYLTFDFDHLHLFDRESGVNFRFKEEAEQDETTAVAAA